MEPVNVGVGADYDLVPAQVVEIEAVEILVVSRFYLNAAAQDLYEVYYDVAFEYLRIVRL